jgi:hypothetical protein
MATIPARMAQRRRTAAQWASENPVLASGEIGVATMTGTDASPMKIGNGTTAWNSLGWHDARFAFSLGSPMLDANGMTRVNTNRVPRIQLPATGTSSIYIGPIGFPVWWFQRGILFGFDVVNDHSSGGNVRFRHRLQQNNVGGAIASATLPLDVTETATAPGAGVLTTLLVNSGAATPITPGGFGSLFSFELTRLGDDGADTLGGPISIAEFVFLAASA